MKELRIKAKTKTRRQVMVFISNGDMLVCVGGGGALE
jgi:hypothetical protein